MEKKYDPKEAEPRIQRFWLDKKLFKFDPNSDKPIFSIDTPPRYTSGPLHIGHATSYSHQDFIARYKKMRGFNVFYPLCFDVNGMPIEVNVEKQGIFPEEVGRDAFIKACADFAEKNIKIMTDQFYKLGFSMDDSIYYQTNNPEYRRLTQISFIRLYKEGLIYKSEAPVTWCPRCVTAIAEAEIEYKTRMTKFNHIKFKHNDKEYLIATTRPELLPACVAVAVHPDDERYKYLIGKELTTPIFNKKVKVIADKVVQPDFGTGIVMICTIGDKDDYEWVLKHKLPLIKAIDEKGNMTEVAGKYRGMSTEEAKKQIIKDLKDQGLLVKQEDLEQNVGACWRCGTPTEYIVAKEWFLKILPFKEQVLKASKEMKWFPEYMERRLIDWVDSLSWDWCISRRRYLATPVPIWECEKCDEIIVAEEEQAYVNPLKDKPPKQCKCGKAEGSIHVFDTWMDSSLTPLYNSFWERDEKMFKRLFPVSLRPQAHDIIRSWAYYSMLRSLLLTKSKPFENIVISGYIMGPDGKPMHASRGNVVDPLEVIEKYSTDTFRYFASLCALGVDTAFKWKDVERGSKILTKIWNVGKFAEMNMENLEKPELNVIDRWILTKLRSLIKESAGNWDQYNFTNAMNSLESFFWNTYCDNYLEIIKHRIYSGDKSAKYTLYHSFLAILKMFAPIMSHITEEIYQELYKQHEKDISIHVSEWPEIEEIEGHYDARGDFIVSIISGIRKWKHDKGLALNAELNKVIIHDIAEREEDIKLFEDDIKGAMKIKDIEFKKADELKIEVI